MAITPRPTSAASLRNLVVANPAVFNAAFNKAPTSVKYGGKTYARNAANSPDQKLSYLAMVAKVSPTALQRIATMPMTLDEVYGLDADRSRLADAEAALRQATAAQRAAEAKLKGRQRELKSFVDREADAQKRLDKVRGSPAGWYEEGQVQLWRDRQQSIKNGVDVGMSSQQGWKPPLNDGIVQNEEAVETAKEATRAAREEVASAQAEYDAENKRLRDEERRNRLAELKEEQARRVEEATAAAEEARANAAIQAASAPTVYDNASAGGLVYDDGYGPLEDLSQNLYETFDATGGADLVQFDAEEAQIEADTFGLDYDAPGRPRGYQSPYSFGRFYECDSCARGVRCDDGGDCYRVSNMRAESMGYDADKITEAGDQGFSGLSSTAPAFDFMSIVPVIIMAVVSLATTLISSFAPPPAMDDGQPSASAIAAANADPAMPPMVQAQPGFFESIPPMGWLVAALAAAALLK